jgi:hypothetical protein
MPATVHRPLKIVVLNANSIGRQACEVKELLQDLKIHVALFSERHLKRQMRFCIQNDDISWTDHEDRHEGRTVIAVMKGIPHTCTDLLLSFLLSVEATGMCIPIGNTEMLLAVVYKALQRLWSDTDITELLGFRSKSILGGDLNAKHPVWSSKI